MQGTVLLVRLVDGQPLNKAVGGPDAVPMDETWSSGDVHLHWRAVSLGGGVMQVRAPWLPKPFRYFTESYTLAKGTLATVLEALRAGRVPPLIGTFVSEALLKAGEQLSLFGGEGPRRSPATTATPSGVR